MRNIQIQIIGTKEINCNEDRDQKDKDQKNEDYFDGDDAGSVFRSGYQK